MKFTEHIFSLKNKSDKKVLRILGLKFTFSRYKAQKVMPFANNKPTIAFQVNEMDKGGLEEVVLQLATSKKIREKYNTVIISEFSPKGYLAEIIKKEGIPVYSFFKNTKNISKLVKTLNIKIAHFHYNISGIEEYKNLAVRTIYTIHNNYIWFNKEDTITRKKAYAFVDKFVAVSSQVKEYFCEKFKIDKSKVLVIPNGIKYQETKDLIPFSKPEIGFDEEDFVFINIASFNPNKYHFAQLKALKEINKKYKNVKLLLIGNIHDEFYFEKVKEMISKLNLENNVKILGFVQKTDVYKFLKMSDCFIMTSLTEGFSIAMSEAMMVGKPMILTDVGGARDVIQNNDIGIVVPHAFQNMQDFNIKNIIDKYSKNEFYFDNVSSIEKAMVNIYENKQNWQEKAVVGKDKIKNIFNIEKANNSYLKQYNLLNYTLYKKDVENLLNNENFDIAIMAPAPIEFRINEGWISRISAIDNIISNKKRIYINPFLSTKEDINIYKHSEDLYEIQISYNYFEFNEIISLITNSVKLFYCHTLHLAEYLIPKLDTGKIIVDIHGITPEEEVMLGNPNLKKKYELIEQEVLKKAKYCVMVSNAMKKHYENKYPNLKPNCLILPIVELLDIDENLAKNKEDNKEIIYSGGIQVWQNIGAMLKLAAKQKEYNYTFLSANFCAIKKKAKKLKIKNATYKVVPKDKLKEIYKKANFGIVLRNESPVNFVACPTKLYEYMACAIVPIVRTPNMGDFLELGFKYITEKEALKGNFPSLKEQKEIILNNFKVVKRMQNMFYEGKNALLEEISK